MDYCVTHKFMETKVFQRYPGQFDAQWNKGKSQNIEPKNQKDCLMQLYSLLIKIDMNSVRNNVRHILYTFTFHFAPIVYSVRTTYAECHKQSFLKYSQFPTVFKASMLSVDVVQLVGGGECRLAERTTQPVHVA